MVACRNFEVGHSLFDIEYSKESWSE